MPCTADSCFKHLALHFKDEVSSLVIWRDSSETEGLTLKRIRKVKRALAKFMDADLDIHSRKIKTIIADALIEPLRFFL